MKTNTKKRKIVTESITYGNTVESIFKKINNYYITQYGDIDFKELILYTCTDADCQYMSNIIKLMPELSLNESNCFILLIKLYGTISSKEWPMPEEEAVLLLDMLYTDFVICSLLKQDKLKITDLNNGNWILKLQDKN